MDPIVTISPCSLQAVQSNDPLGIASSSLGMAAGVVSIAGFAAGALATAGTTAAAVAGNANSAKGPHI